MTTPTLRWRQSKEDARAALPCLRSFLRTTLIPSALRATLIGALFAAGLRWAMAVLRPDLTLHWSELAVGVMVMPAVIVLGMLVMLIAPPRAEYRLERRGIVQNGQLLLRWGELTMYARVPSTSTAGGAEVVLGRRDGGVERVPLPRGALEEQVLETFAAHAPEQLPTEHLTAAGLELTRALSGPGAVLLFGGIAAHGVLAGYALSTLLRALRPGEALTWVLFLAPLLLGPGNVLAVYARRRHGVPARQARALALGVNMAGATLAYIFALLFYTQSKP